MSVDMPTSTMLVEGGNRALYAIADRTLPGGSLGAYALPDNLRYVIRRGAGGRVQDMDGKWYLDYIGGAGALIIGHAHPAVVAAVHERAADGLHFFAILNDLAIRLSQELVEAIPCAEKLIFSTTGSEATGYAMRIARAFTGREKILKFEGGYHGTYDYAAVSIAPKAQSNYPSGQPDSAGIPVGARDTMLVAPFNDLDAVRRIVAENKGSIAAIIVEPVQRILAPLPEFLPGLRTICDENGIVLIFDEVVTGFRLAYGGAQEFFGVTPDLASYGKIVGGGGPLACVAGRADLIDLCDPKRRGQKDYAWVNGTLHGNPIAAAMGLATLAELRAPGVYARLNDRTAQFAREHQKVLQRHGLSARTLNVGSLWHVLFMDRNPVNYADLLGADIAKGRTLDLALIRNGVSVLPNVRRFLSTVHGDAEFEETFRALDMAAGSMRAV